MSKTLEEAIANAEAQAIRDEKEAERKRKYGGKFYDDEVKACLICAEQHRQLAEWLKELQERRKQIKSCKGCKWLRLPDGCANDRCARMYKDRYEAEGRTDENN